MMRTEFEESLLNLLRQQPFKPFVIEADDGRRWCVENRETVNYIGGDSVCFMASKDLVIVDSEIVRQFVPIENNSSKS